ncbi:MAG: TonB family protein [Dysgonamonadaceae bacterium]|jgi:TonB family protein|nr:TonB family protein [Dysgonamonadaceae bacterium]
MITREKTISAAGTTLFFILLMLFLLFSYIRIALPPPQELEGIPVMFGNMPDAFGSNEPPMLDAAPLPAAATQPEKAVPTPPTPSPAQQKTSDQDFISQTSEQSVKVNVEAEKKRREEALLAAQRRQQEEAEARAKQEQENQRRNINNNVSGLFGDNSSGSRGESTGTGVQGVPTGNSATGAKSGVGGIGTYDLGGRSVGSGGLIQPKYTADDYGTVVVNITVDPQGNVIEVGKGKGTNTPSATLLNEAFKAARSTKFNAINSGNNQQGTITYKFNLK